MKPLSETRQEILRMRDIVVAFGNVRILEGADLDVKKGEIHALLGENGAGKSSLVKVLFGLYPRTEGTISWFGKTVDIPNPHTALEHGIAFIHQELPFATHLTVAQNIFLGREYVKRPSGFVDERRQNMEAKKILTPFSDSIEAKRSMLNLSMAQRQIVAIAKAISTGARLIVFDEATTALTEHETDHLFKTLNDLKSQGTTFIMITHNLDDVFRAADRVTVMRDGRSVATVETKSVDALDLIRYMVGRDVADVFPKRVIHPDAVTSREKSGVELRVEGLTTKKFEDLSFAVRGGEVLGLGGLMGAGRTSLLNALFGAIPRTAGRIYIEETEVDIRSPRDAIRNRMAYITEDRKTNGLALHLGIKDNISMVKVEDNSRWGFVDDRSLQTLSNTFVKKLQINARARKATRTLSGGNQQKVVIAKWLATEADIFLLDEPTRGIDVAAKLEVYDLINELTSAGKAVVLVTSELPELLAMSDRFLVLSDGKIVGELSKEEATPESIMALASATPYVAT